MIQAAITERLRRGDPGVHEGWGYTDQGVHYYRHRRSLCGRWRWNHGGLWPDLGATEAHDCPDCTRLLAARKPQVTQ